MYLTFVAVLAVDALVVYGIVAAAVGMMVLACILGVME